MADFGTARLLQPREERHGSNVYTTRTQRSASIVSGSTHLTGEQGTLAWMAPEVLADQPYGAAADGAFFNFFDLRCSNPARWTTDNPPPCYAVYSFGIVMHEILTRELPYGNMSPWRLREFVAGGGRPALPAAPFMSRSYVALMSVCWSADPRRRPPFCAIADALPGTEKKI